MLKYGFSKKEVIKIILSLVFWTVADAVVLGVWIAQDRFIFSLSDTSLNAFISELMCVVGAMVIFGWVIFLLLLLNPPPTIGERLKHLSDEHGIHIEAHHNMCERQRRHYNKFKDKGDT